MVNLNFYDFKNRELILCILQITTLYNAMQLGWRVTKIGEKKYELSKKITEINDFDLNTLMNNITSISVL